MDQLDLLAVQGTLKSFLQHHSSKASIRWHSAFFIVQHSHPYVTTGKTIALTRWIFAGKVMSMLFNILSRLVITFLPGSKHLLISWLQSPSAVILGIRSSQTEWAPFCRIQSKQSLLWPNPGCRCLPLSVQLHHPPASSHHYLPLLLPAQILGIRILLNSGHYSFYYTWIVSSKQWQERNDIVKMKQKLKPTN